MVYPRMVALLSAPHKCQADLRPFVGRRQKASLVSVICLVAALQASARGKLVSADGRVIAGTGDHYGKGSAFVWTQGAEMLSLIKDDATARGISGDGRVVVGAMKPAWASRGLACLWEINEQGVVLSEEVIGTGDELAFDATYDGSVVVGVHGGDGFRWTRPSGCVLMTNFQAYAVADDGSSIVGERNGQAQIWYAAMNSVRPVVDVLTENGISVPPGWVLFRATDISADGKVIVGQGYNPMGQPEGWVADLRPGFDRFSTTAFGQPMGKKKQIGSTLPVKFGLFYDADGENPVEVTSQQQLDAILCANGLQPASPRILVYDVTELADEVGFELPEDAYEIFSTTDAPDYFRYADGQWIWNLRLDSPWFHSKGTYWVEVAIGEGILRPENQLFQTK